MAELLLKVGSVSPDQATYQDGDVVSAYSDNHISCHHVFNIFTPIAAFGFTRAGLRLTGTLLHYRMEQTSEFRFERVSATEVKRTNLTTGVEVVETFQGSLPLYLARRVAHERHRIFGVPGAEFWYGGHVLTDDARLDRVWTEIEARTGQRKADHRRWPMSRTERMHHLYVPVTDFTVADREAYVAPLLEVIEARDNPDGSQTYATRTLQKRRHLVAFRDLLDSTTLSRVDDREQEVDVRESLATLDRTTAVQQKAEPSIEFVRLKEDGTIESTSGRNVTVVMNARRRV